MQVEWLGAGRRDGDNSQSDPTQLINMYRENLGGKAVLKAVPGTQAFAALDGPFMRAMAEIGGEIYAAVGGILYKVERGGDIVTLGDIESSEITTISSNNGQVVVAANGTLFVFEDGVRTVADTGAFANVGSVSFIGQRTVITERGGRKLQWSNLVDATTFDADDFATAEQRDDNILRGAAIGGQFWIFKEQSIEIWYPTGGADVLAYQSGSLIEIGLKAFGLYCAVPNGGFFIGSDNVAYLASGGSSRPISVRAVETAIANDTPERCFYYEQEGHKFCALRFSDRLAWVYDISMNEWHERGEGTDLTPWSAVDAVKAYGSFFVGTQNGDVLRLGAFNRDANAPLVRRAVSANLNVNGDYFVLDALELRGRIGQTAVVQSVDELLGNEFWEALQDANGAALLIDVEEQPARGAVIGLRVSRDRGETFGKQRVRSMGELGEYDRVVKFRALGMGRNACVEVTMTDVAEITLDAQAEVALS